jgi:hypothetical protein
MQIIKVAVAICVVIEKKFSSNLLELDGLALIKKARDTVSKEALMMTLNKMKLSLDNVEELF